MPVWDPTHQSSQLDYRVGLPRKTPANQNSWEITLLEVVARNCIHSCCANRLLQALVVCDSILAVRPKCAEQYVCSSHCSGGSAYTGGQRVEGPSKIASWIRSSLPQVNELQTQTVCDAGLWSWSEHTNSSTRYTRVTMTRYLKPRPATWKTDEFALLFGLWFKAVPSAVRS